nr:ribonuclease H-like domain-containing protein [Tanacetum cinerariifolium]
MPTSLVHDRYKSGEGYHVVPPPYTETFMPLKLDMVFHDAPTVNETVPTVLNVEPSPTKPNKDLSQSNRPSTPIIKDWVSDSEDETEGESMPTQKATSFVHTSEHVKTPRTFVKPDCDYYEKKMVQKPVMNHAMRGNHQHYARMTHPHSHRHVVPTTVLTRSRIVPITAARPVTTDVNAVQGVKGNWGNPQHALKDKGVIDSGCSRHMTGNISYISDFEEIIGGYVAFGGNPKAGKITGKDTECIVLSFDFKLPDDNRVLLRVPRENNMYNVDLKNIFCGMKGIKREFSVARTPQQNGTAERKNMTLIEAARTMLEDSLLAIPFWAEAVNTACYVQNRVLVTKPNNKTPYELLLGRTPSIGFMRPFGCPVTILNTLDPLGSGPTWLFDIDTLTQSKNYQPVV